MIKSESVILGTLLGDAWIQKIIRKDRKIPQYSLNFSQSNKEYAIWKANLINIPYTCKDLARFDKRTNKTYYCSQIYFKLDKYSKENLYNRFYFPKKEVTLNVLNSLDDLSVCIWYLDDGSMYYNGNNCHLTLCINGFNDNSRQLIVDWFQSKYNINFKIQKNKAIRVTSKKECEKFMNIVEKYIPVCMEYKKLNFVMEKYKNYKLNNPIIRKKRGYIL